VTHSRFSEIGSPITKSSLRRMLAAKYLLCINTGVHRTKSVALTDANITQYIDVGVEWIVNYKRFIDEKQKFLKKSL
jgi:hypothetical protein